MLSCSTLLPTVIFCCVELRPLVIKITHQPSTWIGSTLLAYCVIPMILLSPPLNNNWNKASHLQRQAQILDLRVKSSGQHTWITSKPFHCTLLRNYRLDISLQFFATTRSLGTAVLITTQIKPTNENDHLLTSQSQNVGLLLLYRLPKIHISDIRCLLLYSIYTLNLKINWHVFNISRTDPMLVLV